MNSSRPAVRRRWGINERIKFVAKPLLFILCLLPLLLIGLRTVGIGGSLGANPIEELLHELGIWALRFLLITLTVTPLRHMLGKAWLLRFRRMLGLFAFFYAFLHLSVYLGLDQRFALMPIIEDIIERPYITLGMIAVIILTVLAATSPHIMRRRLGKTWQKIHYLIYPASILAVWHFWWQVKKDIREPLIYALILATLLVFRLWKYRRKKTRTGSNAN